MNDFFVIFRSLDHVKPSLDYLNSQHSSIKFLSETEVNYTRPFLDVLIERNNSFSTSVYRNLLFRDFSLILTASPHSLLNVDLFTPFSTDILRYARPTIFFIRKSSSSKIFSLTMGILFPSLTIVLVNFLMLFVSARNYNISNQVIYFSMPFTGKHCLQILSQGKKTSLLVFLKLSYGVIFMSSVPKLMRLHVVYQNSCRCCGASYIGQTRRLLHTRISEHLGISPFTGEKRSCTCLSSILSHTRTSGHAISVDDFCVISSCNSPFELLVRESLLISKFKPVLNENIRSVPLTIF